MRPKSSLRRVRPMYLGAAALAFATPVSAVALTVGQAEAQSAVQITLSSRHATFGQTMVVSGNATSAQAGRHLQLQFEPAGSSRWQALASTTARSDGSFRMTSSAQRSGQVRVVPVTPADAAKTASVHGVAAASPVDSSATVSPSPAQAINVAARFRVPRTQRAALGGQVAHVRGTLLPATAGRQVRLLTRRGGSWRTIATARTGPRGGFNLAVPATSGGPHWLRVGFAGDRTNGSTQALAGNVTAYTQTVASWYDDSGETGCGFHAHFGVANTTLPCGTKVSFRSGGRTVTAVVDDRGPYVGGRDWDLNQNTAAALGFDGVGSIWSSV